MLIVCGFAFDPHVSEEANHYGDEVLKVFEVWGRMRGMERSRLRLLYDTRSRTRP